MSSQTFLRKKGTAPKSNNIDYGCIQIGKVKSTEDLTHNGKLLVWLVSSNTNENLSENWISVRYASVFAGVTDPSIVNRQAYKSFQGTQKSYGFFAVPPDKNNFVLIAFPNKDPSSGYWFACLYADTLTHMIPGIAAGKDYNGKSVPLSEMNIYSGQNSNPVVNPTRPAYDPLVAGLTMQGLINDPLRGAGTSSVWRSKTPDCMGLLSPGGNHIVLDDKAGSELIRIRTKSGAQVLISETDGSVYVNNKSGSAWLEINNTGDINGYAQRDINLHAGRNVNISGKNNVNLQAEDNAINFKAKKDLSLESVDEHLKFKGYKNTLTDVPGSTPTNIDPLSGAEVKPAHEPWSRN